MSEEKKNEVLSQEKELDESEMETVSGGESFCPGEPGMCILMAEMDEKKKCVCIIAGAQVN